jgi:hypothetical protein
MKRWMTGRIGWALLGALAIAVLAIGARDVQGGPLDPPGPPAPTMQALNQMPPDWMLQLSAATGCGSQRFECVMLQVLCTPTCHFSFDGVLDHETGLVWQRDLANWNGNMSWEQAMTACLNYTGGGRSGWRLPTVGEATSLLDPTVLGPNVSSLPTGHPFTSLPLALWAWTSTRYQVVDGTNYDAYAVYYRSPGFSAGFALPSGGIGYFGAWCVRGAS